MAVKMRDVKSQRQIQRVQIQRGVEIRTDPENVKSCKIPERLGFELDGTIRNDSRNSRGELRHTKIYSIMSYSDLNDSNQGHRS